MEWRKYSTWFENLIYIESYNKVHLSMFWTPSFLDLDPNVNPPLVQNYLMLNAIKI
jgi:hypothetical protein